MAPRTATILLTGLVTALFGTPGTTLAQVSRRAPAQRATTTRARIPVFSGVHPTNGGGQKTVMAPAVPPLPDFEKLQMTTKSLPGADVHGAGATVRLTASQPVTHDAMMSVDGAITQPDFGRDGSILFDDMGHREAGTVRVHFHLTEVGRPHVLDCSTVNKPDVVWEIRVGNDTQIITPGSTPFAEQHLSVILVPAQAGDFLITLHPRLTAQTGAYVYTTLGYCEMTVLH